MGLFQAIGSFVSNTAEAVANTARGLVEDVTSWCKGLKEDVVAGTQSLAKGDVVGINANKVDEMIASIEEYISGVNQQLDKLKEKADSSVVKAMQGEYATATKTYVQTAADVCYRIVTQLRYFEDKLIAVKEAYAKKDENMSSTINTAKSDMNSTWTEYQRQK